MFGSSACVRSSCILSTQAELDDITLAYGKS